MPSTREKKKTRPAEPFHVVGIGASAGGLRAIQRFFDNVPPQTGMCFVVIVHLDPDYKSQMAELVQKHTRMPVSQPERPLKIEPNHVYIIPPDKDFSLTDGHIRTSPRSMPNRSRAPIDLFFRTLAETHNSDAVAIVLTGTGSDGSRGISAVREAGGLTMAQAPEDAEFDEMPRNAIATGHVDLVLPLAELASEATRLNKTHRLHIHVDGEASSDETDEAMIGKILARVRATTGHDFSSYRRATVLRRLERRIHFTKSDALSGYLKELVARPEEARALFNDLLINVTSFFRDPAAFQALEREVIPKLFAQANAADGVRVWVAGCATGEEAYTLAILLCEHAGRIESPPHIQIFATDVHEKSFAFAREGVYPDSITADVTAERLERFFDRVPNGYRVRKEIREKVVFANHNVLKDPPFVRIDLVACRNLLIYLNQDAKRRVASVFHFSLRPGGYLMLGSSEGIEQGSKGFAVVDKKQRIFQTLPGPRSLLHGGETDGFAPRSASTQRDAQPASLRGAWVLHQQLLEAYAGPSLLVNADGVVLHFSSRVGAYLTRHGGEPSHKLLDMLPRGPGARVQALLTRAFVSGRPAQASGLRFRVAGRTRLVDVVVKPLESDRGEERVALVLFEERAGAGKAAAPDSRESTAKSPRTSLRRVERELNELRTELQATIEEHEAVVEEARAANEELQSINEEQRATSEELETSKEELQSVNEELRTINQEYRNQNEELAQTNADLENLIDSTDIGTIFLDGQLRVRRYTPAITRIFNFVDSDRGRPISDVTNRLRYPDFAFDLRNAMRTQTKFEREVISEEGLWFLLRISPYSAPDKRVAGVVLTLTDVTDSKRAEIEREIVLHDIQTTSDAKSNFIGVMSHELRTPLNAIVGYAGLMNAGAVGIVSPDQSRQLERISACAMQLARLLDDSLEAARMDSGTSRTRHEPVDLTFLLREVYESVAPLAAKRGLRTSIDVADGMHGVTDDIKIRQILFNLVANAVRYTDAGTIAITGRIDDGKLVVTVADSGIGIAPEHLERIFERFWQVDQTRTRTRGGTGLGLMVSRGLARQLGGEITVESEPRRGSTFRVSLPVNSR